MGSVTKVQDSYLVSSDIGIMNVTLKTVTGYDVDDIVRDKAISYARALQMASVGKMIDQSKPSGARTISSIWLNNDVSLD
jgi:hypothetical protein